MILQSSLFPAFLSFCKCRERERRKKLVEKAFTLLAYERKDVENGAKAIPGKFSPSPSKIQRITCRFMLHGEDFLSSGLIDEEFLLSRFLTGFTWGWRHMIERHRVCKNVNIPHIIDSVILKYYGKLSISGQYLECVQVEPWNMKRKCFFIIKNNTSPNHHPFASSLCGVETEKSKNGWENWCRKNGVYLWWFFSTFMPEFYVYFILSWEVPQWKMIWRRKRKNSIL